MGSRVGELGDGTLEHRPQREDPRGTVGNGGKADPGLAVESGDLGPPPTVRREPAHRALASASRVARVVRTAKGDEAVGGLGDHADGGALQVRDAPPRT